MQNPEPAKEHERRPGHGLRAALKHAFAIPREPRLTDQEREWLEKVAREVVRRGLTAPALMALESARPLNFIGSQLLVFFTPIISIAVPPALCERVAALMEKRGSVQALIAMIEDLDRERRGGAPDPKDTPEARSNGRREGVDGASGDAHC